MHVKHVKFIVYSFILKVIIIEFATDRFIIITFIYFLNEIKKLKWEYFRLMSFQKKKSHSEFYTEILTRKPFFVVLYTFIGLASRKM